MVLNTLIQLTDTRAVRKERWKIPVATISTFVTSEWFEQHKHVIRHSIATSRKSPICKTKIMGSLNNWSRQIYIINHIVRLKEHFHREQQTWKPSSESVRWWSSLPLLLPLALVIPTCISLSVTYAYKETCALQKNYKVSRSLHYEGYSDLDDQDIQKQRTI